MTDDTEHTEAAPSMDDLIRTRGTRTERQHVNFERLFGPCDTGADDATSTVDDTVTADDGDDAA